MKIIKLSFLCLRRAVKNHQENPEVKDDLKPDGEVNDSVNFYFTM